MYSSFESIIDCFYSVMGYNVPLPYHEKWSEINGSTLFFDEYDSSDQFYNVYKLFVKHGVNPIVRVPYPIDLNSWNKADHTISLILKNKLIPLILFDEYNSEESMMSRINHLSSVFSYDLNYFELFNELPNIRYDGEQINGVNDLIDKTNYYVNILRKNFTMCKIIAMAPVNSLSVVNFSDIWGNNNQEQLKRLTLETKTDIVGIHCYIDSWKCRYNFNILVKNLNEWIKGTNKKVWVTECGSNKWSNHVEFYVKWTSRFYEYIKAERILWYRQSIDDVNSKDSGFALEIRNLNKKSPLWE